MYIYIYIFLSFCGCLRIRVEGGLLDVHALHIDASIFSMCEAAASGLQTCEHDRVAAAVRYPRLRHVQSDLPQAWRQKKSRVPAGDVLAEWWLQAVLWMPLKVLCRGVAYDCSEDFLAGGASENQTTEVREVSDMGLEVYHFALRGRHLTGRRHQSPKP